MQLEEINLRPYFPKLYEDVLEIDELSNSENKAFAEVLSNLDTLWGNQFIKTSNLEGVENFERILNIIANPSVETLDFRRDRLLNRFSSTPPFTMSFLKRKLDEAIGVGAWTAEIDYANRTLTIGAMASSSAWAQEITVTITQIKPANLIFISKPHLANTTVISEGVTAKTRKNNYILGVSWILGSTPFIIYENEEVLKVPGVSSLQPAFLALQATHPITDVAKVRVNGTLVITEFESKTSDGGVTILEYVVPATADLGSITKVEMLSSTDEVLTSADVYVDNLYDVLISHKLTFKEGV